MLSKIVPRWIRYNEANTNGNKISKDIAYKMYEKMVLKGKLNFHSPRMKYDRQGMQSASFKINLGRSTLKGSRKYVMPSMSLLFSVQDPEVYLVTNVKQELATISYSLLETMAKKLSNYAARAGDNWTLLKIIRGNISVHPHVSSDGKPCLGYFAEAWSTLIAESNLTALVNVAQSFTSNWTRNDAYWDINDAYRMMIDYKLADNFRDYLIVKDTMNEMSRLLDNPARFSNYECNNDSMTKLKRKGASSLSIYMYARCLSFLKSSVQDTPDGKLFTLSRGLDYYNLDALKQITTNSKIVSTLNTGPVMDWAIVNNYENAIGSLNDPLLEITDFGNSAVIHPSVRELTRRIDSFRNAGAEDNTGPRQGMITTIKNVLNNPNGYFQHVPNLITDEEVYAKLYSVSCKDSSNYLHKMSSYLYLIRSFIKFINNAYGPTIEDDDEIIDIYKAIKHTNKVYSDMSNTAYDEPEYKTEMANVTELRQNIGRRIYVLIEKTMPYMCNNAMVMEWRHFLNAKAKSHIDNQLTVQLGVVKDERRRNITGCRRDGNGLHAYNANSYSEESQLSIETF